MNQQIDVIHTPCKSCSFAVYDKDTQTDCYLDLISKFRNKNIEILEVYDENKEFFVINKKKCFAHKEEGYFKSRKLENCSIEEKASYVREKLRLNYHLIVHLNSHKPKDLIKLAQKISNLTIKPSLLHIVRYKEEHKSYPFKIITKFINSCNIQNWKIKTVLNPATEYLDVVHEIITENKNCKFMLSVMENYKDIDHIINYAQETIYESLSTFIVVSNLEKNSLLFNTDVYRFGLKTGVDILSDTEKFTII
jgi:hypothetical protein